MKMLLLRYLAWGGFGVLLAMLNMPFTTWEFWVLLASVTALTVMEKEFSRTS